MVLATALLGAQYSLRQDPCAGGPLLEIEVLNGTDHSVEVLVEVVDAAGRVAFSRSYHIEPGSSARAGPMALEAGAYEARATVAGDGRDAESILVGACPQTARIEIGDGVVSIVRSEDP